MVSSVLKNNGKKRFTINEIVGLVGTDTFPKPKIIEQINYLVKSGVLIKHKGNKFQYSGKSSGHSRGGTKGLNIKEGIKAPKAIAKYPRFVNGTVDVTRSGFAYIISDDLEKDVLVRPKSLNRAMDGDFVKVEIVPGSRKKVEGKIVEIISRKRNMFAGTISVEENGFGFFDPDDKKIQFDFFVPKRSLNGAKDGQKVVVEMLDWPKGRKSPEARVIRSLGESGENESEMLAILVDKGFPLDFSDKVMKAAAKIPMAIPKTEIKKRRDFRKVCTFTIDPEDAKDFDDAISLQKLDNGNWEVGVHIADVSHYVVEGTQLDAEAYERATSVYLVDRVLPMLPEHISNGVCSLRPEEEKLAFAAVFEMDKDANILEEWFGRTVIYSDRRFTYMEAQALIEGAKGELSKEVNTLNKLAHKLRKKRFKEGSITFDMPEVRFKLDEKGKPIDVYTKERKDAHLLVEDFMLLANKQVAKFVGAKTKNKKEVPFVYRVHDRPDPERFGNFARLAAKFNHTMKVNPEDPKSITKALNTLMKKVQGTAEQNILENLAVRSMAKAVYTTENIGHFGLGFPYYSHFTSPIRRYPDLMVHRLLAKVLDGKPQMDAKKLEEKCEHSSSMEKKAAEAERASSKYKQVEYMSERLGEEFDGVISGATSFGVFVECDHNKCEGLIRMEDLPGDRYFFDDQDFSAIGYKTGRRFRLGEKVRVKVVGTNLEERTIDFMIAEEE